ncbi:hypothetical protein Hs30E_10430 [Lactococcus hodotermopsidis]|uniref:Type IV secretion system coupling protein TraD DNA-binding domain-containing protein n=2 Tax=Pseudolactococcus hodotermopsidis TaxID=2709157 RepID=A0A6A0BAT1_9LACT|nr:hypothetical protein Hs30E_10430 [Lactococcus hodotermopsidis]
MTPQDVMMIFDTKGDFARTFYSEAAGDLILGNSAQYRDTTQNWNIYREILADGWDNESALANINEIGRALFEKNKSESQPFFANAARGVFGAYLLAMIRGAQTDEELKQDFLNNKALLQYFNNAGKNEYFTLSNAYNDLKAIKMYLGDCENTQALGVLAEVLVMVRDTFAGAFGEKGDFSIREFIRNKGGRTLFLEYDLSIGESLAPLYSLLIDLALKEALGRNTTEGESGRVYVIVDELKLLPNLMHMDDAVNFGRSMGVRVLAGLQSVSQIYELYGEHKGKAIITGFSSMFVFRPNDSVTREFAQEHFGKNYVSEVFMANQAPVTERRQGSVVEDWDINNLKVGEAIVGLDGHPPFRFYFDEFKK